jgi:rhamnose utilization protein RhaD (predicted bifunctional aldolase and dehydrogenase)
VNTIAWGVRRDGREQLADRLRGLRWHWIPHTPSGRPLAQAIAKVNCATPTADVFVLANHGLVVCGASCNAAESLLQDVEKRLAITPRSAPAPDCATLDATAKALDWTLPGTLSLHDLGTDRLSRAILAGGVLYPCQAIFLAPSRAILARGECPRNALERYRRQYRTLPPFFILEDAGVILNKQITAAEYAMLIGLQQVVQRVGPVPAIRYLTADEVTCLLNADAYRYRALVETGRKSAV